MSAHILNIFIVKVNTEKYGFHHMTVELSNFYVRYVFYRAHMIVRMRQF
jgi:hypothetical protein